MFGQLKITRILSLTKMETPDQAIGKLLEFTDWPQVLRWFQFPTALVVFVAHSDCPDSGAAYLYDRKSCVWLWVDFKDQNWGGYSLSEFDLLINQCHFFRLAASPCMLKAGIQWLVTPGQRPKIVEQLPA